MRGVPSLGGLRRARRLTFLCARQIAGRFFYLVPFAPLVWLGFLLMLLVTGGTVGAYTEENVLPTLIGLPLAVLGMGLGVRIIAAEVDRRTLEIVYTVPGGAHRVWVYKLAAASLMLLSAFAVCSVVTVILFTDFGWSTAFGCLQAGFVYLVLSTGLAAFFRSEITGAMACLPFLIGGWMFSFTRYSPLFNPLILSTTFNTEEEILAWTVQNRIGMALAAAALIALAFSRANRREKMLS